MESIQRFCGLPSNGTYTIWEKKYHSFGKCFLWTAVSYPSHVILLVTCAYLLGISRKQITKRMSFFLWSFIVLTLLLSVTSLTELILSYALKHKHPPAYVISKTLAFSSWLLCFWVQCRTRMLSIQKKRNNKYILFGFLFIFASSSMQLHYALKHILLMNNVTFSKLPTGYYGIFVYFALNCLFLLPCIALLMSKPIETSKPYLSLNVNLDAIDSENQDEGGTTSPVPSIIYLGQGESWSNPFSRLFFCWGNKLILKGFYHQIKESEDLFMLPNSLDTKLIRERFSKMLSIQRQESVLHEPRQESSHDNQLPKKHKINISLMRGLHDAYGTFFYSLGILQLGCVCLGFGGPVLLNLLLKFMENKQV